MDGRMIERRAHDAAQREQCERRREQREKPEHDGPNAASGAADGAGDEQPEDRRAERVAENHEAEPRDLREVRERRARRRFGDDVVDVATAIVEVLIEKMIFEPGHTVRFDAGGRSAPSGGSRSARPSLRG